MRSAIQELTDLIPMPPFMPLPTATATPTATLNPMSEVEQATAEVQKANQQYQAGVITNKERYNKIVDIWTHAGDEITKALGDIQSGNG